MKPCGSTVMWPTSPALPSHPESTLPSTATPAPIPEEMVRYTMSSGLRSEWNRSPMTPAMVSLWRWTSSVSNSCETGPMRGIRSTVSGRFAGPCTIPAARSRGPIEPIPAATTAVGSIPASARAADHAENGLGDRDPVWPARGPSRVGSEDGCGFVADDRPDVCRSEVDAHVVHRVNSRTGIT